MFDISPKTWVFETSKNKNKPEVCLYSRKLQCFRSIFSTNHRAEWVVFAPEKLARVCHFPRQNCRPRLTWGLLRHFRWFSEIRWSIPVQSPRNRTTTCLRHVWSKVLSSRRFLNPLRYVDCVWHFAPKLRLGTVSFRIGSLNETWAQFNLVSYLPHDTSTATTDLLQGLRLQVSVYCPAQ